MIFMNEAYPYPPVVKEIDGRARYIELKKVA